MYEVICLVDSTTCTAVPVCCSKDKAVEKAVALVMGKGFLTCVVIAVRSSMARAS